MDKIVPLYSPSSPSTSFPCSESGHSLSFFASIPPERVGLYGEYDHQGLTKRVLAALTNQFKPADLQSLQVSQRGAVVVLIGQVRSKNMLHRMVTLIRGVYGTADVETLGVSVASGSSNSTWGDRPAALDSTSFAYSSI